MALNVRNVNYLGCSRGIGVIVLSVGCALGCNASSSNSSKDDGGTGGSSASGSAGSTSSSGGPASGGHGGGSTNDPTSGSSGGSPSGGIAGGGTGGSATGGSGPGSPTGGPGTTGDDIQAICESAGNKVRGCGLLGEGSLGCDTASDTGYQACVFACLENGTCSDLQELICSTSDTAVEDNSVVLCGANCINESSFECDNGTTVSGLYQCDGFDDCGDDSDEASCPPPFVCSDGSIILADWECDGTSDCADGGDESDCDSVAQSICPATPSP